tara:strand:+ start:143 stop:1138 length:996 start_codon:yes stop_codon:yes gene_type:complete
MEQPIASQATTQIFNADCLEKMKDLDDKSVDLIFCDLPYGQTSCAWDTLIDLDLFWKQVMRIKKLNTPIFFTTTTKFGVSLIQSAPKKCFFRYDLVWVKSTPAGFLCAKKMPMRKHEMIYVFYEKLPFYDLSSHTHKFLRDRKEEWCDKNGLYGEDKNVPKVEYKYDPPLPVSVVKELMDKSMYGELPKTDSYAESIGINKADKHKVHYDPPLPVSVVKDESSTIYNNKDKSTTPITKHPVQGQTTGQPRYDPPLPTTMLEIKSTRGKHSTEKPVALMEWVLKYYSKEGDIVLDPTCGSGSTGVACKNMNRNFIGIEMDEEIFKVAEQRLQ